LLEPCDAAALQLCSREVAAEARAAVEARLLAKRQMRDDELALLLSAEVGCNRGMQFLHFSIYVVNKLASDHCLSVLLVCRGCRAARMRG
jgi:hypothetical protein